MNKYNILPIVVLFHKKLKDSSSLNTLFTKSDIPFYVHDNSEYLQGTDDISVLHYYSPQKNIGLSQAYNIAAKFAREHNFEWLLLLDQDSEFPSDAWDIYQEAIKQHPECSVFAPIFHLKNGSSFSPISVSTLFFRAVNLSPGKYNLKKYSPINSGLLIKLDAFERAGGYPENVFLDFADIQFCERLSKKEKQFCLLNMICKQDFSNEEIDIKKLKDRFTLYLRSARACTFSSVYKRLQYKINIIKHTFALSHRTKNYSFVKIFIVEYLFYHFYGVYKKS